MSTKSQVRGHEVTYSEKSGWKYSDNNQNISDTRPCKKCGNIPYNDIDSCLKKIIDALNTAGIPTKWSCCGHGLSSGYIVLKDGRELTIRNNLKTPRTKGGE